MHNFMYLKQFKVNEELRLRFDEAKSRAWITFKVDELPTAKSTELLLRNMLSFSREYKTKTENRSWRWFPSIFSLLFHPSSEKNEAKRSKEQIWIPFFGCVWTSFSCVLFSFALLWRLRVFSFFFASFFLPKTQNSRFPFSFSLLLAFFRRKAFLFRTWTEWGENLLYHNFFFTWSRRVAMFSL